VIRKKRTPIAPVKTPTPSTRSKAAITMLLSQEELKQSSILLPEIAQV
jgi:hypothetical protein